MKALLWLLACSLFTLGAAPKIHAAPPDEKQLYPRTKEEIAAKIKEIEKRAAKPADAAGKNKKPAEMQQAAVNELNIYRYLCGVGSEVTLDAELIQDAGEAAKACKDAGHIAHTLGHFTDKCNLGQGVNNLVTMVRDTMSDPGENNREKRGHRLLALLSTMGQTGFGIDSGFVAQYAHDVSAPALETSYAYPGKGWYPAARLHGNSWSLYLPNAAPAASDVKVRMWKLFKPPKEALSNPAAPVGKEIKIKAVFTLENAINFEPDVTARRDTYWIHVEGGGVDESYLVDLY